MALEMKPACEQCNAEFGPTVPAMICSWECSFCEACSVALEHRCPRCDGELVPRPRREKVSTSRVVPYHAVVFTSMLEQPAPGYAEAAQTLVQLAKEQPGFLGLDSVRDESGAGITVSYWQSEAAIVSWKQNPIHLEFQRRGAQEWYQSYRLQVSRVERSYSKRNPEQ